MSQKVICDLVIPLLVFTFSNLMVKRDVALL